MKTYRVSFTAEQWQYIKPLIDNSPKLRADIHQAFNNAVIIETSEKKRNATKKATATRTARAKAKIQNAINILRLENKPITYYSIKKESGVSHQTIVKYINRNELEKLNTII